MNSSAWCFVIIQLIFRNIVFNRTLLNIIIIGGLSNILILHYWSTYTSLCFKIVQKILEISDARQLLSWKSSLKWKRQWTNYVQRSHCYQLACSQIYRFLSNLLDYLLTHFLWDSKLKEIWITSLYTIIFRSMMAFI